VHAMLEKRDDNWLLAAGRAMLLSLAVVASTVVGWPRYARFSPCGELLVTTAEAEKPVLRVWSLEQRTSLRELRGHTSVILGASFAADGRLFSWGQDGSIRVWDALEGRMLQVIALSESAQLVEGAPPAVWPRATTHDAHRIERSPPS
jgi:WD40 repeat protein